MRFEQWEIDDLRQAAAPNALLIIGETEDCPVLAKSQDVETGSTRILYNYGYPETGN